MKTKIQFLQWLMSLILSVSALGTWAQPYPNQGTQTVCLNSNEPYGVILTPGSTYTWNIIPGSGGAGTITNSALPNNLISINWTSPGTCTLEVTELNSSNCTAVINSILITVQPLNTIALTSAAGTDAQSVCINNAITDITYATTGATVATVAGLPTGVSGSLAGNVVTIIGTPSVTGTFNYTVTLSGGCGTVTSTGTITVTATNTINLTSAAGTDAQTVCFNNAITDITYATTGATVATITGLPTGVSGSLAGNVITITGIPSVAGTFNYTVTLTGGCGTVTSTGTITVTAANTIALTSAAGTAAQTVCINNAITDITYAITGATVATVTGLPTGVSGSLSGNVITITGIPSFAGTFNYTVTLTGGCGIVTSTGTITVNPLPVNSPIYHN